MKMTRSLTLRASWKNGRGGRANRKRSWGEFRVRRGDEERKERGGKRDKE